ncbi:MAG: esterase family protein [Muribaculaceae bacterium]|nr:esterase family protein [Muribaculaceae bacterium]
MNIRSSLTVALILQALTCLKAAKVETISIESPYLGSPESVTVITPDISGESRAYPTVYLLNGYGGDHTSWLKIRPDLPEMADEMGLVLVMPDGRDSWYWDSPVNPEMQMESFFVNTLVPYIDSNYPTSATADQRAISGLSMGGQGAMFLSMRHPDIWANAGSTSGGLDIRPFSQKWKMKESLGDISVNPEAWESHTPVNLIKDVVPGTINIIFDCGADDFFAGVNEAFHKALVEKGIDHDYIQRPGNHSMTYWNNSIPYQLHYFTTKFSPQTPPAK